MPHVRKGCHAMCPDDRWYGIPHHNIRICYECTHDSAPTPLLLLWSVLMTVLTWYVLNPLSCSAYYAVIGYWGNCNLMLCSSDWCWRNYVNVLVHVLHLSHLQHLQDPECLGQDQSLVLYTEKVTYQSGKLRTKDQTSPYVTVHVHIDSL
jgi:hypothetical protein